MKTYVHAYIGEGKGKSTAAVGAAVRASGAGMKVVFVQLLKQGSNENICIEKLGIKLIAPSERKFTWEMSDNEKNLAAIEIEKAIEEATWLVKHEGYDFVVFDEMLGAFEENMISEDVMENIFSLPAEVIITGRRLPPQFFSRCGYITEMLPIAHPFSSEGAQARAGIEY